MTTFQPIILQCPLCKQQMYNYELSSYTVYSSTVYSDSKTITEPFVDKDGAIRICPSCNQAFWVEDAVLDTENPYELVDTLPKALDILDLPFNMTDNADENGILFYKNLLEQGFAYSNEKKYYLRIRLWWAINDLVRYRTSFVRLLTEVFHIKMIKREIRNYCYQKRIFKSYNTLFEDNLLQLILLTDLKTDDDYLMLAEMHREIGSFNKSKLLINKVKDQGSLVVKKIKKRIFFRKKSIFKL